MNLKTLKPRLAMVGSRLAAAPTPSAKRMTGRKLQERRLRVWSADPYCAHCRTLTIYPYGFELDHNVSLFDGGEDTDANTQILCVSRDASGLKIGCHGAKTRQDMGYRANKNRPGCQKNPVKA
ncbi:HNH endonuclease signature motif containing protein [Achromobacter aegrifaciens]|uniref:HNH endonuclease signature motif containing protein n=1 Tax=Achromobacter aegrifaciens TaxID=1287736 RepID=UPI000F7442AE|nr:HNH endonuclease signature motif containing protein [Achromobacter aegrifaciens]RSF02736.1 HNH endonuclease [Achromobacter aegrifaciens]